MKVTADFMFDVGLPNCTLSYILIETDRSQIFFGNYNLVLVFPGNLDLLSCTKLGILIFLSISMQRNGNKFYFSITCIVNCSQFLYQKIAKTIFIR